MNNIEILEEFIEQYNASYPEEKECVAIYPEQIEAIENLIQENKELKENPPIIFKNAEIKIGDEQINKYIGKNYIPKSKVKEKIEELDKRKQDLLQLPDDCARTLGLEDCDEKIILYKELLEGE